MRRAELPISSGSRKLDSTVAGNSLFRILATTREGQSCRRSGRRQLPQQFWRGRGSRSRRGTAPAGERPPPGALSPRRCARPAPGAAAGLLLRRCALTGPAGKVVAEVALEASTMSLTDRQASAQENKETSRCAGHCGPTPLSSSGKEKGTEHRDPLGKRRGSVETYPLVEEA